jgi:mono/diheme cytochrome c family protein
MLKRNGERGWLALLMVSSVLFGAGCRQDMHDNPRVEVYEEGSHRELPEGTIARGALALSPSAPRLEAGKTGPSGEPVGEEGFPFRITQEILDRGENRYSISCLPCHGVLGDGKGMVALRGIRRPPSYHDERLRQAPSSYYYDVITNGFGAMSHYADQLTPEDRWKVIAWVRVLQASQRMERDRLQAVDRERLAATSSTSGTEAASAQPLSQPLSQPVSQLGESGTEQILRGRSN